MTRNPVGSLVIVAVLLAAFGPYLIRGLRTEQAAIYSLSVFALPLAWPRVRVTPLATLIFGTWFVYALVAVVGVVLPVQLASIYPRGAVLAGIDNVTLPLAIMLLVWATVRPAAAAGLLATAARLIAVGMAVNGVIALAMTQVDLAPYLRRFWATAGAQVTVAENGISSGRYSGIFNQPAEAGLAYGIAGLAACYVWHKRPAMLYLVLVPIILGGILSVSKVFVLGGLPIILWHIWRTNAGHKRIVVVTLGVATFLGIAQSSYVSQWSGLGFLNRLLNPAGQNWIQLYTAGRIGGGSSLIPVVDEVTRINPWFGLGAAGLSTAYDNGLVEAFVVCGVIGVACYSLTLVWLWRLSKRIADKGQGLLMFELVILIVGTSVGISVFTANRASTMLWVLIALSASVIRAQTRAIQNEDDLNLPLQTGYGPDGALEPPACTSRRLGPEDPVLQLQPASDHTLRRLASRHAATSALVVEVKAERSPIRFSPTRSRCPSGGSWPCCAVSEE